MSSKYSYNGFEPLRSNFVVEVKIDVPLEPCRQPFELTEYAFASSLLGEVEGSLGHRLLYPLGNEGIEEVDFTVRWDTSVRLRRPSFQEDLILLKADADDGDSSYTPGFPYCHSFQFDYWAFSIYL